MTSKAPAKSTKSDQPTTLTKIVAALMSKAELDGTAKKNKAMVIVPSIANSIQVKYGEKPANHYLKSAVERGIQDDILSRPASSRNALNGSVKIHPKFSKFLLDRETAANDPKEIAAAIRAFVAKAKRSSVDPEPAAKPKEKTSAAVKKPKANFPVAKKKQDASTVDGTGKGKKRSAEPQKDEPKTKKAKK